MPALQHMQVVAVLAPKGTTLTVPDPDEGIDATGSRRYRCGNGQEGGSVQTRFLVCPLVPLGCLQAAPACAQGMALTAIPAPRPFERFAGSSSTASVSRLRCGRSRM